MGIGHPGSGALTTSQVHIHGKIEISIVSRSILRIFTLINLLVLCYEVKHFCLYEDNSYKPDDADSFITQFFRWNPTQNPKHETHM